MCSSVTRDAAGSETPCTDRDRTNTTTHWFPHAEAVPNPRSLSLYKEFMHAPRISPTKQKVACHSGNCLELVFLSHTNSRVIIFCSFSSSYNKKKNLKKVLYHVWCPSGSPNDRRWNHHWTLTCVDGLLRSLLLWWDKMEGSGGATFTAAQSKPVLIFLLRLHIFHTACMLHPSAVSLST